MGRVKIREWRRERAQAPSGSSKEAQWQRNSTVPAEQWQQIREKTMTLRSQEHFEIVLETQTHSLKNSPGLARNKNDMKIKGRINLKKSDKQIRIKDTGLLRAAKRWWRKIERLGIQMISKWWDMGLDTKNILCRTHRPTLFCLWYLAELWWLEIPALWEVSQTYVCVSHALALCWWFLQRKHLKKIVISFMTTLRGFCMVMYMSILMCLVLVEYIGSASAVADLLLPIHPLHVAVSTYNTWNNPHI